MHIFVLGGTGASGLAFIDAALAANHQLTLYARNPSKFPEEVSSSSAVTIIKGEFTDMDAVEKALQHGAEVLVSFAGPSIPHKGTPISDFYNKLFPLLKSKSSIKRCFVLSTASYQVSEDRPGIKWWLGVNAIKLLAGTAYTEINGMSQAVTSALDGSEIEWTIFRVPGLTNSKAAPVQTSMLGGGNDGLVVSRASVADWVLLELRERKWVDKAPALSNEGWL